MNDQGHVGSGRFVTRHWETLNAYCDLVVMRDIAFCTDESQIRSCFHWMLRSLLLGLFQPRYAVNQVRREFSTYMQRLFKRIIEVVVAQSHPTAHAPHVIALRTMSEEEIKTLIDESVIVFTKVRRYYLLLSVSSNINSTISKLSPSAC